MASKIFAATLAVVILTATVVIISMNIKLSSAKSEIAELTAEAAHLQTQLTLANAAIVKQNDTLNLYRAEADNKTAALTNDYERLNKKYQLLSNKSAEKLGSTPDCSAQLSEIYEAQEAFCYER